MGIEKNEKYPHNDIGIAQLYYDLHCGTICYVIESKSWYIYTGKRWAKDECGLRVMEMCKAFVIALVVHAKSIDDGGDESKAYIKYVSSFHSRRKREGLLSDAKSIMPKSLAHFDSDRYLFNCQNGTLNLQNFALQPHRAEDFTTKIAGVKYDYAAQCPRWDKFINEIMCDDVDTAAFLQMALGYALTGDTSLECFFIFYGNTTRNGKSTLSETVAHIMGDYARTIQPQTRSRRSPDGASASPDIARLKGARIVNMPEPERGLELNIALIKQLTGGDTYTGRFLNENPVEFRPEFKIFMNTNHLPRTADDTVFTSGRVNLIPFDRHFTAAEQDTGLKKHFRRGVNKSAILNWLVDGYRPMLEVGLSVPQRVEDAIAAYRSEVDVFGTFLAETTVESEGCRLATSLLYSHYQQWVKDNGYRAMSSKTFVSELRRRCDVRRDGATGNVAVGLGIAVNYDAA